MIWSMLPLREYYTADGDRVMLPLKSLIDLGLVDAAAGEKLKRRLDRWAVAIDQCGK